LPRRRPRQKDYRDLLHDEQGGGRAEAQDTRGGSSQKFGKRSKYHQHNKTQRTAAERAADARLAAEKRALLIGRVIQVHSLFLSIRDETSGELLLCTSRRTMRKVIAETFGELCVGDRVRYRTTGGTTNLTESESLDGTSHVLPEGVIEAVEERETVLMRVDSFDDRKLDPIVANADQFLIVVSMHDPYPRWGLVDRMLVAAQTGGLTPAIVVNKADLRDQADDPAETDAAVEHYRSLNITCFFTSVMTGLGLNDLRQWLTEKTTVLAGHSGVGKSSLASTLDAHIDLRIGDTSEAHNKGKHTTTSARSYPLSFAAGTIIDTPGIKVFAPVGIDPEDLVHYFPDVAAGTSPDWRYESFIRLQTSLIEGGRD
jgi:ribosome biogenesis GTPase